MATGLAECNLPDQFFHCLVNTRDWVRPSVAFTGSPADLTVTEAHQNRDIVVRGIQFDYQYSFLPFISGDIEQVTHVPAITSIRSGLVKMRMAPGGSAGIAARPFPQQFSSNLFFHQDTMLRQPEASGSVFTNFEQDKKYRVMWRGMEMIATPLIANNDASAGANNIFMGTPLSHTASRHVRTRTSVRLAADEGLFFVTEIVNPFLTDNPVIVLDLFGSLVVKTTRAGNRYQS